MSDETQGTAETLAEGEVKDLNAVTQEAAIEEKPEGEVKSEGEETEEQKTERKKLSGAQKAKRRETFLLNQLAEKERLLEEATKKAAPVASSASDDKEPKEADFNGDFFAYQQAMTAHKAGKAAREAIDNAFKRREEAERGSKQAEAVRARQLAHLERVDEAREVIADFDKTMEGMKGVNVRAELIEAIQDSDKSGLLSYHLAKNPDVLEDLNAMSGRELARAMGRLEATLDLPKANKQTKAPAPLTQLKGGASGSFDPAKASMDDYVAKRKGGWG